MTQSITISNGNATGKDTACGIQSCSVLRREQPHDCLEPTKTNTRLREDMFGNRNRSLAIHFEQESERVLDCSADIMNLFTMFMHVTGNVPLTFDLKGLIELLNLKHSARLRILAL